jgi:hypothetical protein
LRFSSISPSFVFFNSSTIVFEVVRPLMVGVGVVDRGGLAFLDRGDTALETALGAGTEIEETIEALGSEWEDLNSDLKVVGTFTLPHDASDRNPFGAGETRLEKASGLFMSFAPSFPSICLNVSKPLGYLCVGGCGLGNLSSDFTEISLASIALRLGVPLLDKIPTDEPPVSVAFFTLL